MPRKRKRKPRRWHPKVGESIVLDAAEGEPETEYTVTERLGFAYLIGVEQIHPPLPNQRPGLLAVDEDGKVWTILEPEKREPWET